MASNQPVTNGEYYDHVAQTWRVWCGGTAVPIRKQDAKGEPVKPPAEPEIISE